MENDDVVCSSQKLEKFAEKMRTISILDYESEKGACGVLGEIILVYFKYVVGEDIHHESNKIEYINNYYYIEIAKHKNYDLYDRYSAFRNVIPDDNFIGNLIQLTALRNHLYQPRVKLHKYRSYAANMLRILYFLNRYSYDLYGAKFIKILKDADNKTYIYSLVALSDSINHTKINKELLFLYQKEEALRRIDRILRNETRHSSLDELSEMLVCSLEIIVNGDLLRVNVCGADHKPE